MERCAAGSGGDGDGAEKSQLVWMEAALSPRVANPRFPEQSQDPMPCPALSDFVPTLVRPLARLAPSLLM